MPGEISFGRHGGQGTHNRAAIVVVLVGCNSNSFIQVYMNSACKVTIKVWRLYKTTASWLRLSQSELIIFACPPMQF
jgi:hypothetical protein